MLTRNSLLHYVAMHGRQDICEILLFAGADLEVKDCIGWTPLYTAVDWGCKDICKLLLDAGADAHASVPRCNGRTPLMFAAEFGFCDICKMLLSAGIDVKAKSEEGCSALHYAAESGNIDICKLLVSSAEANVFAMNHAYQIPSEMVNSMDHRQKEAALYLKV